MTKLAIAIDGPAGAGKSTIAKILAEKLNIDYIDTGAMYRAFTYKILSKNIDVKDTEEIIKLLNNTSIDFNNNHIFLDNKIIDKEIRKNIISNNVSSIAKIKEVREKLVEIQKQISMKKSVIMDGRDIGTHVLPKADFKFFITASVIERGKRRFEELKKVNKNVNLEKIIEGIKERDRIDTTRDISPLKKSKDAIEIDTTNMSIEEVVYNILSIINKGRK